MTRLTEEAVDATVVVVEPTPRSMDVAMRAVAVATERKQGRLLIAANKVADAEDVQRLRAAFPGREIVMIPEDPVIEKADRNGLSPIDVDHDSPAVLAIRDLARLLTL